MSINQSKYLSIFFPFKSKEKHSTEAHNIKSIIVQCASIQIMIELKSIDTKP